MQVGFVSCHPAAISCRLGLQIPLPGTPPQELAHGFGSSKPDKTEARAGPETLMGKNTKGKGAEVLVLCGLDPEEPSAGRGKCSPGQESSPLFFFPFSCFPG